MMIVHVNPNEINTTIIRSNDNVSATIRLVVGALLLSRITGVGVEFNDPVTE